MKVLITGLTSASGGHLARHLMAVGSFEIVGCGLSRLGSACGGARAVRCDIRDVEALRELIAVERPHWIVHLAASADVSDPVGMMQTNVGGTAALLQVCHELGMTSVKILLIGSAAGFGEMDDRELALSEDRPGRPNSFYGASREAAFALGRVARQQWNLSIFFCRPFNLIGPGLGEKYAPAALVRRMLAAKHAGEHCFPLRDGEAVRDFIDIRDAAAAYHAILSRGKPGVPYSVGRGNGVTIGELARELADMLDMAIEVDPIQAKEDSGLRRSGICRSVADNTGLRRDTGWAPQFNLRASIRDMVDQILGKAIPIE